MISKDEAIAAVQAYFASRGADPTKDVVVEVVVRYFADLRN